MKKYSLADMCSDEKFSEIVKASSSVKEVISKLGYSTTSGANCQTVKKRIQKLSLDISHFRNPSMTHRTKENVFIENSTASQQTLRRWYVKETKETYFCSICGQKPFWQGKELTLILDHINGKNHDDRFENLRWVCPNCNQQLETTGYKKMRSALSKRYKKKCYCVDCGVEISESSTRCSECYWNYIEHNSKFAISEITRDILKELIRTKPFAQIGEKFGVTDNAIRKWCEKYNLPKTKKEIKRYNDEEWELI